MAPFLANSKPLMMSVSGKTYFPVVVNYDAGDFPSGFAEEGSFVIDYKAMRSKVSDEDWILWPAIMWDPFESNKFAEYYPAPPTKYNLMGTDDRGRDVFTRLLYGLKYSLLYAVFVWLLSFIVGTTLGAIMGFYGGKVDLIGQRIVEVFSTVPQFFLLIILISIFTPNVWWLIAISSIFGWIPISFYVRGEFLKNRKQEFVEAARSMGAKKWSVIFKHILPNSMTPIITFSPYVIAGNIASLAALDYLGFGLEIPTPSWGELLNQAQKNYTVAWWLAFYPSAAIFVTLLLLNFVGEGVRDAMDPKSTT
jgi:microcin C transport system permease protein